MNECVRLRVGREGLSTDVEVGWLLGRESGMIWLARRARSERGRRRVVVVLGLARWD